MEICDFVRDKYGTELLVDAAPIADLEGFIQDERPHALSFYDLMLVTDGQGTFELDDHVFRVEDGGLFFTSPGQVRRWNARGLRGLCLFFTAEFIQEFFQDALFLHRLWFFHDRGTAPVLRLSAGEGRELERRFAAMAREIRRLREDSHHALRADLYGLLVHLNRAYAAAHGLPEAPDVDRTVARFCELVERDFATTRRLSDYGRALAVSPGHLAALTRRHLGRPPGALIRNRVLVEAKRRLLYSDAPAERIARDLGFRDPSYFSRFFKRETGIPPSRYRSGARRVGERGAVD